MGTWGYKPFENDGAADWLYDLEEATEQDFVFEPLRAAIRAKGKIDLDDALEGLAAAEILAGARFEPPRDLPRIAHSWVKRMGLVPKDADLKLARRAVEKISKKSELADTWQSEGKLATWQKELKRLSQRLAAALKAPLPRREKKAKAQRETLADLILAVASGQAGHRREDLQQKLQKMANPDALITATIDGKKSNRLTPLQWVASRDLIPEAKILLARGAKVEGVLSYMSPPIVFALDKDHLDMVALLLEAGSDPQKALFSAIADDKIPMMKLIIDRGIDLNATSEGGWTAIHWAARNGAMAALKMLLKRGCDPNVINDWAETPLHEAAAEGQLPAVKFLLEQGVKLNPVDSERKTPLDLAEEMDHADVARFLRQNGGSSGATNP